MEIADAALMFDGWYDGMIYDQTLARRMTVLIASSCSMDKGTAKRIMKVWKIDGDEKAGMDQKLIDKLMKKQKQHGNGKA